MEHSIYKQKVSLAKPIALNCSNEDGTDLPHFSKENADSWCYGESKSKSEDQNRKKAQKTMATRYSALLRSRLQQLFCEWLALPETPPLILGFGERLEEYHRQGTQSDPYIPSNDITPQDPSISHRANSSTNSSSSVLSLTSRKRSTSGLSGLPTSDSLVSAHPPKSPIRLTRTRLSPGASDSQISDPNRPVKTAFDSSIKRRLREDTPARKLIQEYPKGHATIESHGNLTELDKSISNAKSSLKFPISQALDDMEKLEISEMEFRLEKLAANLSPQNVQEPSDGSRLSCQTVSLEQQFSFKKVNEKIKKRTDYPCEKHKLCSEQTIPPGKLSSLENSDFEKSYEILDESYKNLESNERVSEINNTEPGQSFCSPDEGCDSKFLQNESHFTYSLSEPVENVAGLYKDRPRMLKEKQTEEQRDPMPLPKSFSEFFKRTDVVSLELLNIAIEKIFEDLETDLMDCSTFETKVIVDLLGQSKFVSGPVFQKVIARNEQLLINREQLLRFLQGKISFRDPTYTFFNLVRADNHPYIYGTDFEPLILELLHRHPGMSFLRESPTFQQKYVQTVIARIFYQLDLESSGKITLENLERP